MLWMKPGATERNQAQSRPDVKPEVKVWAQIVVIGYGNSLRRDDGAGLVLAQEVVDYWERVGIPARLITDTQLLPEMAAQLADDFIEAVVFADTSAPTGAATEISSIRITEVSLDSPTARMGHHLDPTTLLVYTALLYGRYPRAWLVTIPGTDFSHGEGFSRQVNELLAHVGPVAHALLETIKEAVPCMN